LALLRCHIVNSVRCGRPLSDPTLAPRPLRA
jgi:hypothetical protein